MKSSVRPAARDPVERLPAIEWNAQLFAGHNEGGRNWARFASLIIPWNRCPPSRGTHNLFTKLAYGHLARDIDALMPWAYTQQVDGA